MKQFYKVWIKYSVLGSCLLFALAIGVTLAHYFLPVEKQFLLVPFCIPLIGLIYFCDHYKKNALLYVGLVTFLLCGSGLIYLFDHDALQHIKEAFIWLMSYDGSKEAYIRRYGLSFLLLICFGACLVSYLICHMGKWQLVIDLVVIIVMVIMTINHIAFEKLAGICMMIYLLGELSKTVYAIWYKQKDNKRAQQTAAYLLPVFMVLAVSMWLLPYKEDPIKWEYVKKAYRFVKEAAEKITYDITAMIEQNGDGLQDGIFYNNANGKLGGDLKVAERDWLKIKLGLKTYGTVYMAASYKEKYKDGKWKNAEDMELPIKEEQLDYYELLYNILRQEDLKYEESLIRHRMMDVSYVNIKTRVIFAPAKTKSIESENSKIDYTASGILSDKVLSYHANYGINFAEWNMSSPRMIDQMKQAEVFSYEAHNALPLGVFKTQAKIGASSKKTFIDEDRTLDLNNLLAQRAQYIKTHYTQLPEDFSEGVTRLAQKITVDCEDQYDKVMALKAYLSGLKYTINPGPLPKDKELSSYFLLESQEGYCTYFATALVTMGRSLGIPMRYVEGALLDYSSWNDQKQYVVGSSKAHAWAEAYFEGVGWVIVDATPGYETLCYGNWPSEEMIEKKNIKGKEENSMPTPSMPPQLKEAAMALEMQAKQPVTVKLVVRKLLFVIGSLIGVFMILLAMLIIYIKWHYKKCYQKSSIQKQFILLFHEMLGLLALIGMAIKENETLAQFEKRIKEEMDEEGSDLTSLCSAYSALRYGGHDISLEHVRLASSVCIKLSEQCRIKKGRLRSKWLLVKNQYESIKKIEQ